MPDGVRTPPEPGRALAHHAEGARRHYPSNGCSEGRYRFVGISYNVPDRSTFVLLVAGDSDKRVTRKWTDAATAEHRDRLHLAMDARAAALAASGWHGAGASGLSLQAA